MAVLYGQERMALFMERGRPALAGGFLFSFVCYHNSISAQLAVLCNEKRVR